MSACARLQPNTTALEGEKHYTVDVKLTTFAFEPDNLQTYQGNAITFRLRNISGGTRNFTVKDPEGTLVRSVDVGPDKTVDVTIEFTRSGTYEFFSSSYPDKARGMQGRVVAIDAARQPLSG